MHMQRPVAGRKSLFLGKTKLNERAELKQTKTGQKIQDLNTNRTKKRMGRKKESSKMTLDQRFGDFQSLSN